MKRTRDFFAYARARYQAHILKDIEKKPGPWSTDPILQKYRFCNVHREDDRVTTWFRENIRDPLRNDLGVLLAVVAFRWFNRIETGAVMLDPSVGILSGEFHGAEFKKLLLERQPHGPWVTGSYMVKSPNGKSKVDGLVWCIENIAKDSLHLAVAMKGEEPTLEGVWNVLKEYPFMGDFMAYEVVTDLRFTCLLESASDIMSWANPGPGAARGLSRILEEDITLFNRHSKSDRAEMMALMQELLAFSLDEDYWPQAWGGWEMREVEHTLCEFDKYERVRLQQGRPRQILRQP